MTENQQVTELGGRKVIDVFPIEYGVTLEEAILFLAATRDLNFPVHVWDEKPIAPGFFNESKLMGEIERYNKKNGLDVLCKGYNIRFAEPVPYETPIKGKVYVVKGDNGQLHFIPEIRADDSEKTICGNAEDTRRNSVLTYTDKARFLRVRDKTPRDLDIVPLREREQKLLNQGQEIDVNYNIPQSFLVSLSSYSFMNHINSEIAKGNDPLKGKRLMYRSRIVNFYEPSTRVVVGEDISLYTKLETKGSKECNAIIQGMTSGKEIVFEAKSLGRLF